MNTKQEAAWNHRKPMTFSDLVFGIVFVIVFISTLKYWIGNKEVEQSVYDHLNQSLNNQEYLHHDLAFKAVLANALSDEVILVKEYRDIDHELNEAKDRYHIRQKQIKLSTSKTNLVTTINEITE
jgi:hypothetical protein